MNEAQLPLEAQLPGDMRDLSMDERIDALSAFIDTRGGDVALSDLLSEPVVKQEIGRKAVMQTISDGMSVGRLNAHSMLSHIVTVEGNQANE